MKPGRKWANNIRIVVKCMSFKGVKLISLAVGRDNW